MNSTKRNISSYLMVPPRLSDEAKERLNRNILPIVPENRLSSN